MKKTIKMIGFDLDGTLLTDDKKITVYTQQVLNEAIQRGIVVLPATGRPTTGLPKELLECPGIQYALTANGARIVDIATKTTLYESLISPQKAIQILDVFEKYDAIPEIYYDGIGYTNEALLGNIFEYFEHPSMAQYILDTRVRIPSIREKILQSNRYLDKVQAMFRHSSERESALGQLQLIADIEITGALKNNLEINHRGVNKGKGLLELGKILGIKKEEIMCFGDGANDIEMLKEVGYGVAMENAKDDVKLVADYITTSNNEEGVAKAIRELVLEA